MVIKISKLEYHSSEKLACIYLLQLAPSCLFGALSRDVTKLLNPGGILSHSSKRIPLPREKEPAAH